MGTALIEALARLATPVWLVSAGGGVAWCNQAARSRLGLADDAEAACVAVGWRGDTESALTAAPAGAHVTGTLSFRTPPPVQRVVSLPCHLSRTGERLETGEAVVLVEAIGSAASLDDGADCPASLIHHLSHELRTPLTAVLGFSEIIADDMIPSPGLDRYQDYAGEIRTAATYMLDLINNLLDLARMESGQLELREEPCDLARLISLTVRLVAPRATQAGVRVAQTQQAALPPLLADPTLVRQMLTNLVGNAVKFSAPNRGRVDVSMDREEDGGLAVVVRDTGIGMRADQILDALRPFHQVHAATIAEKGSGLGLTLTKALIERHGGRLIIDSAPGTGTEVRLVFPAERLTRGPEAKPRARRMDGPIRTGPIGDEVRRPS